MEEPPLKKSRQLKKKWKESELLVIIEYLHEERDFEHPTAQFYYKKLIEKTQLEATWDLVRWKVRHLKSQYKKANDWVVSTGTGVLEEDDGGSIEASVLKICPHYNRLKEVFSKTTTTLAPILCSDSSQLSPPPPSHLPSPDTGASPPQFFEYHLINEDASPSTASMPTAAPTAATPTTKAPRTAISQLAKIQGERIEFEKKRLQFEEKKLEREIAIEEKKIVLEEKRIDLEIKKQENESKRQEQEVKLRKLEIEMKERVAKYEIDKKYAN